MVKVYVPRRVVERNRWLRSDGKPNFKDRIYAKPPELEVIANKEIPVLSMQATVMNACEVMSSSGARLVPITDPERRLLGIVTGMDLVDYFGGGIKYTIVQKNYNSNIYSALSASLREIANTKPLVIDVKSKLHDLLNLMVSYGVGALPVVSGDKVVGVITEGELIKYLTSKVVGVRVSDVMSVSVISLSYSSSLGIAMKLMVNLGIRRLPVTRNGDVIGMLTWRNIIDLFGSHKVFDMLRKYTFDEVHSFPVADVMEKNIVTIEPDSDIGAAAAKMSEEGVDSLLVTKNGNTIGIITERDILYGVVVR